MVLPNGGIVATCFRHRLLPEYEFATHKKKEGAAAPP